MQSDSFSNGLLACRRKVECIGRDDTVRSTSTLPLVEWLKHILCNNFTPGAQIRSGDCLAF
jgi:hypothetical protein